MQNRQNSPLSELEKAIREEYHRDPRPIVTVRIPKDLADALRDEEERRRMELEFETGKRLPEPTAIQLMRGIPVVIVPNLDKPEFIHDGLSWNPLT